VTVILVSHNMDEVAEFCERVIVLDEGSVAFQGPTDEFFRNAELVMRTGLELPQSYRLARALKDSGCTLPLDESSSGRFLDSLRGWLADSEVH